MFDGELVIRSGSLAALKQLCTDSSEWSGMAPYNKNEESNEGEIYEAPLNLNAGWLEVLTSVVIPGIRRGLKQSTDVIKKGFVNLLSHTVICLGIPSKVVVGRLMSSGDINQEQLASSIWYVTPSHTYLPPMTPNPYPLNLNPYPLTL
jgi:hypothetical protein